VPLVNEERPSWNVAAAEAPVFGVSGVSRRRFLGATAAILTAGLSTDGFAIEPHRVLLSQHDVLLPGLAPRLDGLRIAQVSDVHLPANRGAAERTVELISTERPDIVVLTGDQCETSSAVAGLIEFAHAARGRLATIAVLGNWDYRGGTVGRVARDAYERAGVTLLVNDHEIVGVGGATLAFVGLDDVLTGSPNGATAAANLADGAPAVWLVHEPRFADEFAVSGPNQPILILSGHTHGGQIRLPGLPAYTPKGSGRFVAGWYEALLGRLYVSRGIGTADIRARLFCPPELPIFTLRREPRPPATTSSALSY
jgi:predicted MPP superfamily phosphohydrolase